MTANRLIAGLVPAMAMAAASCSDVHEQPSEVQATTGAVIAPDVRLANCRNDQRVKAGLVTAEICAGADIFFRETFGGNGRTCGSCHPAAHNFTIDGKFINDLFTTNPDDPLFVFRKPELTGLESEAFFFNGGILENVDGFSDPTHRFVGRSTPHVLSLATSIAPDTTDLSTNPPRERTGWGGDGAPGTGTLREFLTGAVKQHYPKTLARVPGPNGDFILPVDKELDYAAAFQMSLGRLNELNLEQVRMFDAQAEVGRQAYMDPARGRCNFCHVNGGANAQLTGKNANFDTGVRFRPAFGGVGTTPDGRPIFDAGFGGAGLAAPNVVSFPLSPGDTTPNGFGNNTFNTPPVIEFADTQPGFHNDSGGTPEAVVAFYSTTEFRASQASADLVARFGSQIAITDSDAEAIARFIRTLNVALNLDMAKQRLNAAKLLATKVLQGTLTNDHPEIQKTLMTLALGDINDALSDLLPDPIGLQPQPFYPVAQDRLGLAKDEIAAGLAAPTTQLRKDRISNAVSRVENARDTIGSNITFVLGQGNVMF